VFEKVPEPWFKTEWGRGEDFYFYCKAQQAGFKAYVDTSVACLHMAEMFIGEEHVSPEKFLNWKVQKTFAHK
jgi:hypothetical protein